MSYIPMIGRYLLKLIGVGFVVILVTGIAGKFLSYVLSTPSLILKTEAVDALQTAIISPLGVILAGFLGVLTFLSFFKDFWGTWALWGRILKYAFLALLVIASSVAFIFIHSLEHTVLLIVAILFALATLSFFEWLFKKLSFKKGRLKNKKEADEPITHRKEDLLNHTKYADIIFDYYISSPQAQSGAFVLSVNGGWGEGKTGVLNLLQNRIKKEKGYICTTFNPWYFADRKAVLSGFFQRIFAVLNQNFILPPVFFRYTFFRYQRFIESSLKNFGLTLDFSDFDSSNPESYQREITEVLTRRNTTLVVFIDDLDRLPYEDQILLVFTLVGLHMDFRNIIFVLSFDREVIDKRIHNHLKTEANVDHNYLEKIIDQEIDLPQMTRAQSQKQLFQLLETTENVSLTQDSPRYEKIKDLLFQSGIKNMRDIKRFTKSFAETYKMNQEVIDTWDLFFMECIKVLFPNAYIEIQKNPDYFTVSGDGVIPNADTEPSKDFFAANLGGLGSEPEKNNANKTQHWDLEYYFFNYVLNMYPPQKQALLKQLLQSLFPVPTAVFVNGKEDFVKNLDLESNPPKNNLTDIGKVASQQRLMFKEKLMVRYFGQPQET